MLHSSNTTKVLLDLRAPLTWVYEGKTINVPRHWDLNLHSGPVYGLSAATLFCSLWELAWGLLCSSWPQQYRDPGICNYMYIWFWCWRWTGWLNHWKLSIGCQKNNGSAETRELSFRLIKSDEKSFHWLLRRLIRYHEMIGGQQPPCCQLCVQSQIKTLARTVSLPWSTYIFSRAVPQRHTVFTSRSPWPLRCKTTRQQCRNLERLSERELGSQEEDVQDIKS